MLDAQTVRAAYCYARKLLFGGDFGKRKIIRYDGGKDQFGRTYQCVWEKLAACLTSNQIEPQTYFVEIMRGQSTPPTPWQTISSAQLNSYFQRLERQKHAVSEQKQLLTWTLSAVAAAFAQRKRLHPQVDPLLIQRSVLADPGLSTPYLLRYCLACRLREPVLAACFMDRARREFVKDVDVYSEAWAEFVTPEIRAALLKGTTS